jgi:3-oxoacyl-[acyl-carrier protein] reductase
MKPLEGKVAIVTGATKAKGLGKAIAVKLAQQGAKVVLTGRAKSQAEMEQNVTAIKEMGSDAMGVLVDVSNPEEVNQAVQQVVDKFGRIDILVNNAGVGFGSAVLTENQDKDWNINYGVNVKGTMELCRGVVPYMEKSGGGAIVNVASTAGIAASVGMPYPYVATKHALVGATKVLALEFASSRIRTGTGSRCGPSSWRKLGSPTRRSHYYQGSTGNQRYCQHGRNCWTQVLCSGTRCDSR